MKLLSVALTTWIALLASACSAQTASQHVPDKVSSTGVVDPNSISPALMAEMYRVGDRPWHYRAFISLMRNAESWEAAQNEYGRIGVPVLLIYGDRDWSRPAERERTRALIPGATMKTIAGGGHFLPLDRPQELSEMIIGFAGA